jgi:hypothetical protein
LTEIPAERLDEADLPVLAAKVAKAVRGLTD